MRLDQRLVELGHATSRTRAQTLVRAGVVTIDGLIATKPSQKVGLNAEVRCARDPNPWVSRAALKLAHALDAFNLDPSGATALDIGASTGGFTEVLLAHGAAKVHALDVGHGQLHPRLAADTRGVSHEGINAKAIPLALIPPLDWIVTDVSFISLIKALPIALTLAKPGATLVALIKPQFEVGPAQVGKGGLVRDEAARRRARETVHDFLVAQNWRVMGEADSPIRGGDGNIEYLISAQNALT